MVHDDDARAKSPFEQLAIPGVLVPTLGIPRSQRVYANRTLSLAEIEWVGFEVDFTLAVYDRETLSRMLIEHLVAPLQQRGYPEWLVRVNPDMGFALRGLLVDKRLGHLLKVDRERRIIKGCVGHSALSAQRVLADYHGAILRGPLHRFGGIDSWSSIAETSFLAAMVDAIEQREERIDIARLHADVRECGDDVLRDPAFIAHFEQQIPVLLARDPQLPSALHKFRSAGKRLFLLTNSSFVHSSIAMSLLLDRALDEYPLWRNYFDCVVVSANKPSFFLERTLFRERAPTGPTEIRSRIVSAFDRSVVLEGGNQSELEKILGCAPDKILYVSNRMHADAMRARGEGGWRIATILPELEHEIESESATAALRAEMTKLQSRRTELEDHLRWHQMRFKEFDKPSVDQPELREVHSQTALREKRSVDRTRSLLREVDQELRELQNSIDSRFHPAFGSMLKAGSLASLFGAQLRDHSCVYTSRVSNFAQYSPLATFHAPEDILPHQSK